MKREDKKDIEPYPIIQRDRQELKISVLFFVFVFSKGKQHDMELSYQREFVRCFPLSTFCFRFNSKWWFSKHSEMLGF